MILNLGLGFNLLSVLRRFDLRRALFNGKTLMMHLNWPICGSRKFGTFPPFISRSVFEKFLSPDTLSILNYTVTQTKYEVCI